MRSFHSRLTDHFSAALDTSIYRLLAGYGQGDGEKTVRSGALRAPRPPGVGRAGWLPLIASGERRLACQPGQAAHVVDQVGEADLGGRPGEADGAHEQAHPGLLLGEDVLDVGA